MIQFKNLDNKTLSVIKIALDGYQRFSGDEVEKYFAMILNCFVGKVEDFNIWKIRELVRLEDERRNSNNKAVILINSTDYDRIKELSNQAHIHICSA